jgi:hypothetical protein
MAKRMLEETKRKYRLDWSETEGTGKRKKEEKADKNKETDA